MLEFNNIVIFAHKWQTLVGSAVPIIFTILMFRYQNKKRFKQGLKLLEEILVTSINDLNEFKEGLESFIEKRLNIMIEDLKTINENEYYFGLSNFPVNTIEIRAELINIKTENFYLANKLTTNYAHLKTIKTQTASLHDNFMLLLDKSFDMSTGANNQQKEQVVLLSQGLSSMKDVIERVVIRGNINTTVKSLLQAHVYIIKYIKHPHFTPFLYEKILTKFIDGNDEIDKINKLIEKDVINSLKIMNERLNKK